MHGTLPFFCGIQDLTAVLVFSAIATVIYWNLK